LINPKENERGSRGQEGHKDEAWMRETRQAMGRNIIEYSFWTYSPAESPVGFSDESSLKPTGYWTLWLEFAHQMGEFVAKNIRLKFKGRRVECPIPLGLLV
jgi:hypothetical protein